jgi:hypothetical protein
MRTTIAILSLVIMCGCGTGNGAGSSPAPQSTVTPSRAPAHFTATLDRSTGTLTFAKVAPALGSGITPASVNEISDPALGGTDDPTPIDVDLISPQTCTFSPGAFQCAVEMIWGSTTRSLPNPEVFIDQAISDGVETFKYDAQNSDGNDPLGLSGQSDEHGLWVYTNEAIQPLTNDVNLSPGPYYLTAKGSGFNTGTRYWELDDAGGHVEYDILVYASLYYGNYEVAAPVQSVSYVDACTGGTATTKTSVTGISIPFDFTLYDQNYGIPATVNIGMDSQIALDSVAIAFPGSPPVGGLPSASAPHPSIWPFWDTLKYGPSGKMCYQLLGAAPQRQLVVEWRGMDFANAPDRGSDLDFEAFLDEGTSNIDVVWQTLTDAPGDTSQRAEGSEAWFGVQNATGTVAAGYYQQTFLSSGTIATFLPEP